jgi:uncharacterized membrane protein
MEWFEFATAFALFFLSHSLPARPPVRHWFQARLGAAGFTLAYSVLSLGVLGWLIGAAGRAPHVPLWDWAPWQAHVPLVVMLPVCLLLGLSIARPNPFSFGGAQNERFDPKRPGIVRLIRHPLLLALALWALAHIVPNGDLAHVILFGTFAGFAILGARIVDRRKRRSMGAEWQRLRDAVAAAPRWPMGMAPSRSLAGVALYIAMILLHPVLFGVSPLP